MPSTRLPIAEVQTPYRDRPQGSQSKLRTFRDGWRILRRPLSREGERPLRSLGGGGNAGALRRTRWPLLTEYLRTGLVPRLPTAILAMGLTISVSSASSRLDLDTVTSAA